MREGWTYKKIGDFCNIKTGKLDANAANENGMYPFFTCSKEPMSINSYAYDCECVLIAGNGDLNVKYYNGKFNAYQRTYILSLKEETEGLYMPYIYNFFLLYVNELRRKSIGGIIKYIKLGDLANANIPVPPLSEQQSIVAELDKINELISLKKAQLSDLDNLAQSIFYDMFGDPIENEKGWEVRKLGEVVDITAKLVDPNQEPYCNQFHVGPANIIGGTGEIVDCLIVKDENLISGKYAFKSGAVLYSKIRPNLNKVAIPSFDGVCSADMYPLSIKTNAVNMYIMRLLMTKEFLKYAVNCSGRARMPKINREALFEFKFCLPPLSLQHEFARRIELIEQQKAQISSTIKDLETLLASRMQYWFD